MNPANLQKAASELEALARQLQQRSPQEATIKQRATAIRSEWGPVLSSQSYGISTHDNIFYLLIPCDWPSEKEVGHRDS